jgi:hypothetical protein
MDVAIKEAVRQGKINTALSMTEGQPPSAALVDEEKREAGTWAAYWPNRPAGTNSRSSTMSRQLNPNLPLYTLYLPVAVTLCKLC